MVLLSQMIRSQAVVGSTDASWFQAIAGRQGGRWAEQHVQAAFPHTAARKPENEAARLEALAELHDRGVVTDAEFESLRGPQ